MEKLCDKIDLIFEKLALCFWTWIVLMLLSVAAIIYRLFLCDVFDCTFLNINLVYVATSLTMLFYILAVYSKRKIWLSKRRYVDLSEIRTLLAEFESYSELSKINERGASSDEKINIARKEYECVSEKLKKIVDREKGARVFELDVLGLRKALVDIYPCCELEAKCYAELRVLRKYSDELDDYKDTDKRIVKLLNDDSVLKGNRQKSTDKSVPGEYDCEIRAELKEIKEQVAFLDKDWAIGEIIMEQHLWMLIGVIIGFFLMGILPIVLGSEGSLNFINWAFLGMAGGLFSALLARHQEGYTEIGETAGKKVWKVTLSNSIIGGMTAVLLYFALELKLIDGRLFPDVNSSCDDWRHTGKAIFWGLFSGISIKIYSRLAGIAEGKIGGE